MFMFRCLFFALKNKHPFFLKQQQQPHHQQQQQQHQQQKHQIVTSSSRESMSPVNRAINNHSIAVDTHLDEAKSVKKVNKVATQ